MAARATNRNETLLEFMPEINKDLFVIAEDTARSHCCVRKDHTDEDDTLHRYDVSSNNNNNNNSRSARSNSTNRRIRGRRRPKKMLPNPGPLTLPLSSCRDKDSYGHAVAPSENNLGESRWKAVAVVDDRHRRREGRHHHQLMMPVRRCSPVNMKPLQQQLLLSSSERNCMDAIIEKAQQILLNE